MFWELNHFWDIFVHRDICKSLLVMTCTSTMTKQTWSWTLSALPYLAKLRLNSTSTEATHPPTSKSRDMEPRLAKRCKHREQESCHSIRPQCFLSIYYVWIFCEFWDNIIWLLDNHTHHINVVYLHVLLFGGFLDYQVVQFYNHTDYMRNEHLHVLFFHALPLIP